MASDYGNEVGDTPVGVWCYKQPSEAGEKAFTKITTKEVFLMLEDVAGNKCHSVFSTRTVNGVLSLSVNLIK